jgi:hypothetical protein
MYRYRSLGKSIKMTIEFCEPVRNTLYSFFTGFGYPVSYELATVWATNANGTSRVESRVRLCMTSTSKPPLCTGIVRSASIKKTSQFEITIVFAGSICGGRYGMCNCTSILGPYRVHICPPGMMTRRYITYPYIDYMHTKRTHLKNRLILSSRYPPLDH